MPDAAGFNLRAVCLVLSFVLLGTAVMGCGGPDPKVAVGGFYTALQKGEFVKAATLMEGAKPEPLDFGDSGAEEMARSIFASLKCAIGQGVKVSGEYATVQVAVTGPDLVRIIATAMTKAMPVLLAAAFGSASQQATAQVQAEAIFRDAFTDPQAPMVTSETTLKLRKVDGKWLIAEGENPFPFLTEKLDDLSELFGAKGTK